MRVVAGTAGGLRLVTPPGRDVRPTTDRVREALFGALGSLGAVEGATVLDLFAGSGALGIEALSRGAAGATFVDRSPAALDAVRRNLAHTRTADRAVVVRSDALAHLAGLARGGDAPGGAPPPDLVLCDPPYGLDTWDPLLAAVAAAAPGAVVAVESDRSVALPPGWEVLREKRYGGTWVVLGRAPGHTATPPP